MVEGMAKGFLVSCMAGFACGGCAQQDLQRCLVVDHGDG